jgi:tetratricopeptide (TPR) repeat protein
MLFAFINYASMSEGDRYYNTALRQFKKGLYTEAIQSGELALAEGVERIELADVYFLLGRCSSELEINDGAIAYYEQAIELDDTDPAKWTSLGVEYRLRNDLDKALESYDRAIEIDPNFAETHSSIGVLHMLNEEPEKAIVSIEKAISLDPSLANAHANMAVALAMIGYFDESDRYIQRAIARGYQNVEALRERIVELQNNAEY